MRSAGLVCLSNICFRNRRVELTHLVFPISSSRCLGRKRNLMIFEACLYIFPRLAAFAYVILLFFWRRDIEPFFGILLLV